MLRKISAMQHRGRCWLLTALTKVMARVWVMDYLWCNIHLTPRCYFIISNPAKCQTKPNNGQKWVCTAPALSLRDIKRAQNESFKKLTIRENGSLAFIPASIKIKRVMIRLMLIWFSTRTLGRRKILALSCAQIATKENYLCNGRPKQMVLNCTAWLEGSRFLHWLIYLTFKVHCVALFCGSRLTKLCRCEISFCLTQVL